ncbi:MAG: SUF system FeS assembly protein, NifU family [Parcubacteria group bacterium GW2011_GWA1_47_8]|nr:MAG: SUF system FeS assembly protein, NifU family [Parcubacteria group bacterium GW2011_GWA1_47_8]KKW07778.1 MAG: SUF system FeS assembly protein, NifU family [Parcubacteria group bacterium GW2011_GWA2_49_16]
MDEELYKENLLDHNRHPHNKRVISGEHHEAEARNASCGDRGVLMLAFDEKGTVSDAAFQGEGCAVSQAGLSMLTDKLKGMTTRELKLLSPGDIYTMLGVQISPGRANCALLGYAALEKILKDLR